MARLYANENFPLPAVEALRGLGHDILTTYESGNAGIALPDEQVWPSQQRSSAFSSRSTASTLSACMSLIQTTRVLWSARSTLITPRSPSASMPPWRPTSRAPAC
jgi:hypothetical protein